MTQANQPPANPGRFTPTRTARWGPINERGSAIVTSNPPFEEWPSVFRSERLTGALLDRLTHHIHVLELNAESYRLRQSKKRRPPVTGAVENPASAAPDGGPPAPDHHIAARPRIDRRRGRSRGPLAGPSAAPVAWFLPALYS